MPRFFFDLSAPGRYEPDHEGLNFDSLEEAYLSASQAAVDISIDMLRRREDPSRHRFEVRGEGGDVVLELPFLEVLQPGRAGRPRPEGPAYEHLQVALARNRKLRAEMAEAFAQVQQSAKEARALTEIRWVAPGTVEAPNRDAGGSRIAA